MMAFFLVMWLVTAVSKEQRAAIFDYFKNPSMEPGKSVKPAPGQMGPGGASTSLINLGGGLDAPNAAVRWWTSARPRRPRQHVVIRPRTVQLGRREAGQDGKQTSESATGARAQAARVADGGAARGRSTRARRCSRSRISCCSTSRPKGCASRSSTRRTGRCSTSAARACKRLHHRHPARARAVPEFRAESHQPDRSHRHHALPGHQRLHELGAVRRSRQRSAARAGMRAACPTRRSRASWACRLRCCSTRTNPRNPINRRISIIVMTKQAEEAALKTDVAAEAPAEPADHAPAPAVQPATAAENAAVPTQRAPPPPPKQGSSVQARPAPSS